MMNAKLSQQRVSIFTTLEQPTPLQAVAEEQDLKPQMSFHRGIER